MFISGLFALKNVFNKVPGYENVIYNDTRKLEIYYKGKFSTAKPLKII